MVSAKAMASERIKGYEVGADDYIVKPFDLEELRAKVRVYLRLKTMEELHQLKSDVLTLLSHETATPLNGILAPLELVQDTTDMDPEERFELLEMSRQSATRLKTLY
jgi:DNA-binding response OmpR family regulator